MEDIFFYGQALIDQLPEEIAQAPAARYIASYISDIGTAYPGAAAALGVYHDLQERAPAAPLDRGDAERGQGGIFPVGVSSVRTMTNYP